AFTDENDMSPVTLAGGQFSAGTRSSSANNLVAGTNYYLHMVLKDLAGNYSSVETVNFMTLSPPAPSISAVTPDQGASGISITIDGTDFGSNLAGNYVSVGGNEATITAANSTQITATLPAGLKSNGKVVVVNTESGLQSLPGYYDVTFAGGLVNESSYSITNYDLGVRAGQDVAVGDFNNDGNLDFIAVQDNNTGDIVQLATGDGNGAFTFTNIPVSVTFPKFADVGDVNNDGNLDLVVCDRPNFNVILGNGDGTFQAPILVTNNQRTIDVQLGDMNNDGFLDVVLSQNITNNEITVFFGDGTGQMQNPIATPVNRGDQLVLADFNEDGNLDAATPRELSSGIELLPGNGDGTFGTAIIIGSLSGGTGLSVADYNSDGLQDMAFSNSSSVEILLNTGSFSFSGTTSAHGTSFPRNIRSGDFDGDGNMDLAMASNTTVTRILLGDGTGGLTPINDIPASSGQGMDLDEGDFNNDGKTDLVVANYADPAGNPAFDVLIYQEAPNPGPGGVSTDLLVWLKADAGVTGTTQVSSWADQSGNGANATESIGPELLEGHINYNPALNFNATDGMAIANDLNSAPYTVSIVYNSNGGSTLRRAISGSNNWLIGPYNGQHLHHADNWITNPGPGVQTGVSVIGTAVNTGVSGNSAFFVSGDNVTTSSAPTGVPGTMFLGGELGCCPEPMDGDIAEVIVYSSVLSVIDRQKMESYLAVKYGLTLDQSTPQDYIASNGSVIWSGNGLGFLNNIGVIGRDDASELNQKQSRSEQIGSILGVAVGSFDTDNQSNANTFDADLTFLAWGHDGADATEAGQTASSLPGGIDSRMTRVWRIEENLGNVSSAEVQFDLNGLGYPSTDAGDYSILV
ncbi:MAG: FG-GAP-like repeat-containing protein, partial [Cyclobacteriaceae bacterium]